MPNDHRKTRQVSLHDLQQNVSNNQGTLPKKTKSESEAQGKCSNRLLSNGSSIGKATTSSDQQDIDTEDEEEQNNPTFCMPQMVYHDEDSLDDAAEELYEEEKKIRKVDVDNAN